ncbi:uncharacterized protein LOC119723861 isoform X1 [Patiria miniata]|uniref:PDZ domain-containing protein n=1 Tax=Patiria miniata TaxID=46514 RepID=A0A913ZHZ8_PATMI|nr:uncharacterized protein LOC119723861 isoform X1 [Patiria miniata]
MTDIMSQSELKWGISSETGSMDQPPAKRPLSPDDTGSASYKSQKSVSDVLGPEMAQIHLIAGGEAAPNHGVEERVSPALLSEAAALMGAGMETMNDGEGLDEIHAEGDSHRVKNLIQIFEHSGQEEASQEESFNGCIEVEERISSSTATEEEFLPGRIIAKTVHKVKEAVKIVGHTVVEGVKKGVQDLRHDFEIGLEKFHLPQSSLEHRPDNNVHVRHPDKLIGGMVGLGMHIQKDAKGHLVHSVIPDGLAAKSKLQENDIIVSVNENDVTSWEFEELQQFFGSLEEVDFKIVVEREQEDEGGAFVCHKVTISIKILLEGDQVMVDIDVKVHVSQLQFNGESEPYYIFQNQSDHSTKYLILKNNCFCMSTANDLTPCRFKRFYYSYGAMAFININNNSPLDHGEPSRIGVNSSELTDKISEFWTDDRIFFTGRQDNTAMYTFQLASQKDFYLTTDAKGNLTTTFFSDKEAVDASGQFSMEPKSKIDKMTPSDIQKYNSK